MPSLVLLVWDARSCAATQIKGYYLRCLFGLTESGVIHVSYYDERLTREVVLLDGISSLSIPVRPNYYIVT